ncbi:interleukin 17a/f1 isoform X2 [Pseudoliparis swirei]|uniref:interleukin 17a/f1 isoform X2 n=1 Tax=Pseudoliparis swirei TaxID=2059687 RepID=UPI0024BEABC4|nr:interleukin 17a/f1 isoform X2 [Pseudoliparis swirei]
MWSSTVSAACVVMMMMMTMTKAVAMPKGAGQSRHSARTHRKSSDGVVVETVPLQLDPSALVPPRHARPLQNISVSPWTYNVSHDSALFPPVLSEARCLLRGCLDSEGLEDLSLESRPIMHQVLLLRRVKSAGAGSGAGHRYHYRLESRLLAVGCTCIRPVVRRQD